jgi:hypothetical protein
MIKGQIGMIMTEPFSNLNLLALMPQLPQIEGVEIPMPTTPFGWLKFIRAEKKRIKEHPGDLPVVPDRGEMLMVKQLLYFERYGKMYLGDQPLIYDPAVYKKLLALPQSED